MLAIRIILKVKPGCAKKVVEWIKSLPEYGHPRSPHGERVYWKGPFSPRQVVIHELTFESLAEYESYTKEVRALPRIGEAIKKLGDLVESSDPNEAWSMEVLT